VVDDEHGDRTLGEAAGSAERSQAKIVALEVRHAARRFVCDQVQKLMGGRALTQDFFRLFLIPGVHHCVGGPGLTDFDALTLLEHWVEKGQPPDVMIASRTVNGVTERTRPIYPYPLLARYLGHGDSRQASSFVSVDPTRK